MPHVVVADDAFPLKRYMLKPYPGRTTGNMPRDEVVFNYRLSRARRIIENAFGIMSARFQLFLKSISADPKNVNHFVKAGLALHNFLITQDKNYSDADFADRYLHNGVVQPGQWRRELKKRTTCFTKLASRIGNNHSFEAKKVRETFKNYFHNEGHVDWQDEIVDYDGHI